MPFVRTSVRKDTSPQVRQGIVDGIHTALVDSIGMPQDELFNMITEYDDQSFHYDRTFNNITRGHNQVVIEITLRRGRSDAMKRTLYSQIATNLQHGAGIAPSDIFIFLHENDYSDWSVGNGQFAMALVQQRG